jgi:hypothetical protein
MASRIELTILMLVTVCVAAVLIAWTTGLLDLGANDGDDFLVEHRWQAAGTQAVPEFHDVNLSFKVGPDVRDLDIDYKIDLPSDIALGIPGSDADLSPEVRLVLYDGSGTIVWTDVFYTSASMTEVVNITSSGVWGLSIWARAYGYEGQTGIGTSVEFHDSLKVTVSAS